MFPSLGLKLAILGVVALLAGYTGWTVRSWKADAADKAWLEELNRQKAQFEITTRELVAGTQQTEVRTRVIYRTIRQEIPHATTGDKCLSADAVRVYNDAVRGPEPLPKDSAGAAGAAGAAQAATDADVLANAVDNYEICNRYLRTLNAIRAWDKKAFGNN